MRRDGAFFILTGAKLGTPVSLPKFRQPVANPGWPATLRDSRPRAFSRDQLGVGAIQIGVIGLHHRSRSRLRYGVRPVSQDRRQLDRSIEIRSHAAVPKPLV